MHVYVESHFHSTEYWSFDSLSRQTRKLCAQWYGLVKQGTRQPGEGCFYFDGQEGIALYARFFRNQAQPHG